MNSYLNDFSKSKPFSTKSSPTHLVAGQDLEALHDLLGGVGVGRLARHEVQEGLEGDVARAVGVHDGHDALEVSLSLEGKGQGLSVKSRAGLQQEKTICKKVGNQNNHLRCVRNKL